MGLGKRSTATEALRGSDLTGKLAVVTGGNSGIGLETVRALASAGVRVILTCRRIEAGQAAADRIASEVQGLKGSIEVKQLDLADLASVKKLADDLLNENRIDYLILNAGVMMCPRGFTRDGFETQWGTNHVGHFALTEALLPKLKTQETPSRIIVLSSAAHKSQRKPLQFDDLDFSRRKYSAQQAYGQSKLANLLFVKQLATQLKDSKVTALAVHPGVVETPLWRHTPCKQGCCGGLLSLAARSSIFGVKTAAQGAATSVYAAVAPELESRSGLYLADCAEAKPSKQALDAQQAERLWQVTEEQLAEARAKREQAAVNGSSRWKKKARAPAEPAMTTGKPDEQSTSEP